MAEPARKGIRRDGQAQGDHMRAHVPPIREQRHRIEFPARHQLHQHGGRREQHDPARTPLGERIHLIELVGVGRSAARRVAAHARFVPIAADRTRILRATINQPDRPPMQRAIRNHQFAFLRDFATRWDVLALIVALGVVAFLAEASRGLLAPLSQLDATPLSLAPVHLPVYAARTTLRMFAAMVLSLLFTLSYATWAAKSARAAKLLIPLLDILQSVPILGFISITVVFFLSLVPGRVLGAEFAAIFGIFTSQAWNMAFSFYQSLRTVPVELEEAARSFRLSAWARFWRLEVPFAMPPLVWNMMMSMSGGWFFVVASEAFTVGAKTVTLPGMGAYIALAIADRNLAAVGYAIGTMLVVILVYDQLLFRPLVAWADRFRFEQEPGATPPRSWVLESL